MVHPFDRIAGCAGVLGKLYEQYSEREHYKRVPDWNDHGCYDLELNRGCEGIFQREMNVLSGNECRAARRILPDKVSHKMMYFSGVTYLTGMVRAYLMDIANYYRRQSSRFDNKR